MGLKQVKSDIIEEAESKAEKIREEGREKEQEIISEAEEEAEKIREEKKKELEKKKESYRQKMLSNARMKARKTKMKAKERMLNRAFNGFEQELQELDKEDKEQFFNNAVEETGFPVGKVIGQKEYEEFTDEEFEEKDVNGFILVSEDEERQVNYTVQRITQNFRDSYRQKVAAKLFEG